MGDKTRTLRDFSSRLETVVTNRRKKLADQFTAMTAVGLGEWGGGWVGLAFWPEHASGQPFGVLMHAN